MRSHMLRARADLVYVSNVVLVGAASGTTSATMPTHQVGDLILLQISRIEATSAAVTPVAGYTVVPTMLAVGTTEYSGSGVYLRAGYYYKIAASASEVTGTWTGASAVTAIVLRGQNVATPFGGKQGGHNGLNSLAADYITVTIAASNSANMLLGMAVCNRTNISLETPPAGMTNRHNAIVNGTHETTVHSKIKAGAWPTTTVNHSGTAGAIYSAVIEIISS